MINWAYYYWMKLIKEKMEKEMKGKRVDFPVVVTKAEYEGMKRVELQRITKKTLRKQIGLLYGVDADPNDYVILKVFK